MEGLRTHLPQLCRGMFGLLKYACVWLSPYLFAIYSPLTNMLHLHIVARRFADFGPSVATLNGGARVPYWTLPLSDVWPIQSCPSFSLAPACLRSTAV